MKYIGRENLITEMNKDNPACEVVSPGETVVFETYDCFTNQFLPEDATFENVVRKPGNPCTGPLYVEGAEPGDMLKISILDIETGPVGIVMLGPNSGNEKEFFPKKVLSRVPVKNGNAYFKDKVVFSLSPMIGTIGVAPEGGGISTITPGNHGGNMDCTQIKKGSILYLPVYAKGGLLAMGDFHGVMGDGEVEDCGLEIEGKATVEIDVVKQPGISWPVVETEDKWMVIVSEDTVEEAWTVAVRQMYLFLKEQVKMDTEDAGMLLTLAGDVIVCQTVNPKKTVRVEFPKYITQSYGYNSIF